MGVLGLLSGSWVVVLESQLRLGGRDTLGLPNGSRVLLPACRKIGMGLWVVVLESQLHLGGRDTLGLLIGPRVLLPACMKSSTDQSTGSCTEGRFDLRGILSGFRVSSARSSTSSRGA